jgi:hypothetical protein
LTPATEASKMGSMKRGAPLAILLLLAVAAPFRVCAAGEDFDNVVDFSVTLKSLSGLDEAGVRAYGLTRRYVVLDGTVASVQVLSSKEESFEVQVKLVSGEWLGLEEVRLYECLVRFQGGSFARLFPARVPRNPDPELIVPNDRVLVVARIAGRAQGEDGRPVWVLEGLRVRPLR